MPTHLIVGSKMEHCLPCKPRARRVLVCLETRNCIFENEDDDEDDPTTTLFLAKTGCDMLDLVNVHTSNPAHFSFDLSLKL